MRKNIFFLAFVLATLFSVAVSADGKRDSQKPMPAAGWEGFRSTIQYPEILRRAGIDGVAIVTGRVDEMGSISELNVRANHDVFSALVERAVRGAKWLPAKVNGKQVKSDLVFTIHFMVVGDEVPMRLTVETPAQHQK